MKAAVFNGIRNITIEELEKPKPDYGEFVIEVKATALCGSDLRTYLHGHPKIKPPQVLGHEFAGIVHSVGEGVTQVKVGDKVAVAPGIPCTRCYHCERGNQNMCEDRELLGIHHPGAFAEYVKIPAGALRAGTVVKLLDTSSFELATLGDPLVACMNGQEILDIKLGDTVLVLGAGPIGIFHCMLAHLQGALKVILVDINDIRLNYAKEQNIADHYINSANEDIKGIVADLTDGKGVDKVIVANTSPAAARQAVELVAKNGKVSLFAGFPKDQTALGLDGNLIHYKQIRVMGAFGSTPKQYRLAQELLSTKKIDGEKLITHRISLEEINEGFKLMMEGKALKVVITF